MRRVESLSPLRRSVANQSSTVLGRTRCIGVAPSWLPMMWWRATAAYIVLVLVLRSEFARVVSIQVSAYWSTSWRVWRAGSSFFSVARTSSAL